jgi:hypothetical protein
VSKFYPDHLVVRYLSEKITKLVLVTDALRRYSKMIRTGWIIALTVVWFLCPFFALAKDTSLRCSNNIIEIGDSKNRVAYFCGEPMTKEIVGYTKLPNWKGGIEYPIERWTYDTSIRYFTTLTFKGDRVVNIEDERKY